MDKRNLTNFISKYFLSGNAPSVAWEVGDQLKTRFITDDRALVGEIIHREQLHTSEGGVDSAEKLSIYNTELLLKMLSVLETDITFEMVKRVENSRVNHLILADGNTTLKYMLSDPSVISPVPEMKKALDYGITIQLDKDLSDRFLRARSALPTETKFVISKDKKKGTYQLVLGGSGKDVNRITLDVITNVKSDIAPISFSVKYFAEILAANKDAETGAMEIAENALAKISFNTELQSSTYYLLRQED